MTKCLYHPLPARRNFSKTFRLVWMGGVCFFSAGGRYLPGGTTPDAVRERSPKPKEFTTMPGKALH